MTDCPESRRYPHLSLALLSSILPNFFLNSSFGFSISCFLFYVAESSLPISFRGFSPFLTFKHSCSPSLFAQSPAMTSCQSHSPQISIFTSLHETQIHATGMAFPDLQIGTPSVGQESCQSHHLSVNPVCPYTSFLLIDLSILLISVYKT